MLAPPTKFPRDMCAYCGSKDDLTTDHVPPKSLFPKPRPSNIITVPACRKCHFDTSEDDEYFRLMLLVREDVGEHPKAQANLDPIFRSLKRKEAEGLRKSFSQSISMVELHTTGGLYIGDQPVYNVDMTRIPSVVERVVRGLYFAETCNPLGRNNKVLVYDDEYFLKRPESCKWAEKKIVLPLATIVPKGIDDNMFLYRHFIADENPSCSVWGMSFYGGVSFLCCTVPS
jgi:hypothetical protein